MLVGEVQHAHAVARWLARRYHVAHLADELEGAALVGLAEAHLSWKPDGGCTYTAWCTTFMVNRATDALRSWMGRNRRRLGYPVKAEASIDDLTDYVEQLLPASPSAEDVALADECDDPRLKHVLAALVDFDLRAVEAMWCVAHGETVQEVADRWGVTESRISQIRTRTAGKVARTAGRETRAAAARGRVA